MTGDEPPRTALTDVVPPPPAGEPTEAFRLAVAIINCHGRDALARYLDGLTDELLCATTTYWPGGRRTAPEVARRELWAAGRRRRRAYGWTHWPPSLMSAAADLAGRPPGNTQDTNEADR